MTKVKIAHLSDPHFGTIADGVQAGLIATLKSLKPDLVLMSGDITQRALRWQFEDAKAFKDAIAPLPFFAVPGNHDIPLLNVFGRFFRPYHNFHTYFQALREKDIRLGDVRVVGLNSTSRWRHVQGSLDLKRIKDEFFSGWDGAKIKIAMVHHPLDCAKYIDDKNRLRGRDESFEFFHQAKIDLVLSGHVHDPFIAVEEGMILSVAGTCLSWRTRLEAPNSFNLVEADTDAMTIEIARMDIAADKLFYRRPDWRRKFAFDAEKGWLSV